MTFYVMLMVTSIGLVVPIEVFSEETVCWDYVMKIQPMSPQTTYSCEQVLYIPRKHDRNE